MCVIEPLLISDWVTRYETTTEIVDVGAKVGVGGTTIVKRLSTIVKGAFKVTLPVLLRT